MMVMKVGDVQSRLRTHGLRITHARKQIVIALAQAEKPLSADEISKQVRTNRVTVYRTLKTLEEAGCVLRFTFQNQHVYELVTTHSHYVICRGCERVERISSCTLGHIEETSLQLSKKFASVDQHMLQLSGVCKECA